MNLRQLWQIHTDIIGEYDRLISQRKPYQNAALWTAPREAWRREFTGLLLKFFALDSLTD